MRKIAPLFYWLARRLHRVASFLNERGYRFEHGVECGVIWDSPLARLQAEFRQSVRDREFDPAQRLQSSLVVDRCARASAAAPAPIAAEDDVSIDARDDTSYRAGGDA